ncbi:MAG: DNA primase [Gammaproteobacteria bacterium]
MSIPSSFIDQILDQSDIVDIIGRRIQLTKKGQNFWCLCPFHDDKKPSMAVNQDKQFFYCFVCNASGNSIHFLRRYENLDFVDAVETVASSIGLEVPYTKQVVEETKAKEINEAANSIYKDSLKSSEGSQAVSYLKKRGISGETAAFFNLGYAKDGWSNLFDKFSSKYSKTDIAESGLFSTKEDKTFDFFRDRLMFPIRNIRGQCIAFGGRTLGDGEPKYLNSPETKTYSKSNELFGLFEAREINKKLDSLIVVEGYMDVIALHQNGVRNAVASLGTAITAKHVSKLMRYAKNIYVAFDGDLAGRKAAWKAVENALPILREDVKIGFIFLEDGHDPDSYINEKGKEAFLKLIDNSISFSKFFLARIKKVDDLETIEGRSKTAKFAIPLVSSINNETLKQAYIEEIASICRLDFASLVSSNVPKPKFNPPAEENSPKEGSSGSLLAHKAIVGIFTALIQHPQLAGDKAFDAIKENERFLFLLDIQNQYIENPDINASIIFEQIESPQIKRIFSEALMSEIDLSEKNALSMLQDCLHSFVKNQKDREEILKEKYNMQHISSAERRELQQFILKKAELSDEDRALLKKLSSKKD